MRRSQLRQLAGEYAEGELARDDYVRRRRELIDAIVGGDIEIRREAPPADHPLEDTTSLDVTSSPGGSTTGRKPYLFAGLAAVVGALGWLVVSFIAPPTSHDESRAALRAAPAPAPDPARESELAPGPDLVERFVTANDWSVASVAAFRANWLALTDPQRASARNAAWFKRMTTALRSEIKTQKTLLSVDQSGAARQTGLRLLALADLLGISDQLPSFPVSSSKPERKQ